MQDLIELAKQIRLLAADFKGPIQAFIYLCLFVLFCKVVHIDIKGIPKALLAEFRELRDKKFSVGAFNAFLLVLVFVFGALIIASEKVAALNGVLSWLFGATKAGELTHESASPMFFVLGGLALVSLWCFHRVEFEKLRQKRRRTPAHKR